MANARASSAPRAVSPGSSRWLGLSLNFVSFVDGLGAGLILPALPFLALHYGAGPALVTALVAAFNLAGFFGNPLLGRLSDRFGRAPLLVWSLIGSIASYVGIAMSGGLGGVFGFRIFGGLVAGRATVVRALASDGAAADHVNIQAWLATSSAIGAALGPAMGAGLALLTASQLGQYQLILGSGAGLTLVALLAYLAGGRGSPGGGPSPKSASHRSFSTAAMVWDFRRPFGLSAAAAFAHGVFMSCTVILAHAHFGWGVPQTGLLLSMLAALLAIGRIVVLPRLVKAVGAERALLGCIVLGGLSLSAMALAPTVALFVPCAAIYGLAGGLANVLPTIIVSMEADAGSRGYALGLNQGIVSLAMFASAAISGVLFQFVAPYAPHLVGTAVLLVSAALLLGRGHGAQPRTAAAR